MPPRKSSSSARDHGDWAVPYQPADFTDIDLTTVTWTARAPHLTLEDVVYRHVEAEGPIHRQGAGSSPTRRRPWISGGDHPRGRGEQLSSSCTPWPAGSLARTGRGR